MYQLAFINAPVVVSNRDALGRDQGGEGGTGCGRSSCVASCRCGGEVTLLWIGKQRTAGGADAGKERGVGGRATKHHVATAAEITARAIEAIVKLKAEGAGSGLHQIAGDIDSWEGGSDPQRIGIGDPIGVGAIRVDGVV